MKQTREQFVEQMKARIDKLDAQIDKMEAKVAETTAIARIEAQQAMTDLKQRREGLGERMAEIQAAGADAWVKLKKGIEDGMEALEEAFDDAKSRVTG